MTLIDDITWLGALKAAGAEEFDTGRADRLWGTFDRDSVDSLGQIIAVRNRKPLITCRDSDVEAHELVKGSVIKRVADGVSFVVRDLEPDGTGMTVIRLGA